MFTLIVSTVKHFSIFVIAAKGFEVRRGEFSDIGFRLIRAHFELNSSNRTDSSLCILKYGLR